jgi:hypothetical protein
LVASFEFFLREASVGLGTAEDLGNDIETDEEDIELEDSLFRNTCLFYS